MLLCRRLRAAGTLDLMSKPNKPNNLRTALILFSVAAVFFASVIVKQFWLR
jgi:hypothetical protein